MSQSHSAGIEATRPDNIHQNSAAPTAIKAQSTRQPELGLENVDRDVLFADFKPLVQRLMRQYGTDPDLREELVGEIYFRFCALLDAYESNRGVPLRAYLVKQLSVSVYTYVRHHWRLHRREAPIDLSLEDINLGWLDDPTTAWIDGLFSQQIRDALPAALADLPKRQSLVLRWRYYEERSFEDIAATLGIQPATARSLLRHAVAGLRRKFANLRPVDRSIAPRARTARPAHSIPTVDPNSEEEVESVFHDF
jgi:RNA polymerase sigma-70 factor (ECF subfamily)